MEMIEGMTGTSSGRPADAARTSRQDAADATTTTRPATVRATAAVPAHRPEDATTVPTGTDRRPSPRPLDRPEARPERRQDAPAQDTQDEDADTRTSPRHLRKDVPADPGWLTGTIAAGFAALSVAATVLAADGQVKAAERAQVDSWLKFLAPGVLELLAILLILLGYRRGRHGGSPWRYWLGAAGVGGYAIFLTSEHAPTIGAGLLYGGASGATILLTFAKFYEDLIKYQRDVLGRVPSNPPSFGTLWLTNRRLAWRSLMLAIEFDIETLDEAKAAGRTWLVTHDDIREFLLGPGWARIHTEPRTAGDAKRDRKARDAAIRDGRARADDLAVRAADAAVAKLRGKPFHVPALVEVATVAAQTRPAPAAVPSAPPAPAVLDIAAEDVRQDVPATSQDASGRPHRPGQDARALTGTTTADRPGGRPEDVRADVPDVPTVPTAPPSGLTIDDIRAMIPADLVAAALKLSASWDWAGELARLDTVMPGWHVIPRCPTAPEIRKAYGVGNDRGSVLRRMVEALRGTLAESAALVDAATGSTRSD